MSGPVVDYLCRNNDADVTVGTSLQEDVEKLLRLSPYVRPEIFDVQTQIDKLEKLVDVNDIVIRCVSQIIVFIIETFYVSCEKRFFSLLPSTLHPSIAKMCIKYKTNMVTASYQSEEMISLHKE